MRKHTPLLVGWLVFFISLPATIAAGSASLNAFMLGFAAFLVACSISAINAQVREEDARRLRGPRPPDTIDHRRVRP